MGNEVIAKDEMAGSIGTKISAMATAILRENVSISKYFRDVSAFAVKGVDSITFPRLGSFTVQNRGHGQAGDRQKTQVKTDTLPLDKNAYIGYGIDGSSEVQSSLNFKLECARIAAEDHSEYFEESFLALLASVATAVNITVGAEDVAIVKQMTTVRKAYREAKAKIKDGVWVISTSLEEQIISNPELFKVNGLGNALIVDGQIQKLWGMPVEVKIMTEDFYLVMGQAVNYGFQLAPNYAEQPDLAFGTKGIACAMDQLFGVGASYVTDGKSAVIFKKGVVS